MGGGFAQCRNGALRGCHRVALRLGFQFFIRKQQCTPGFPHVPLDIVGQHAEQDVRTDSRLQPMVDGADMQIERFHGAERPFDFGKSLVAAHRLGRVHLLLGHAGADDVDAIERGFGGDRGDVAGELQIVVGDGELEVLGDLAPAKHGSDGQADPVSAPKRLAGAPDAGLDADEFLLGGVEQFDPLAGAFGGEIGIAADHQPLAGKVR